MTQYEHLDGHVHPVVRTAARDQLDRHEEEAGSVLSTLKSYLSLYRNPAQPVDKEPNTSGSKGAACLAAEETADTQARRPPVPAEGRAIHVRDDLKPLLRVMQPDAVRKVLAVACAHDVWVQDVMAHRLPAILAAREPFGYLIHLIHSGEDWTRPVTPSGEHKEFAVQGSVKGPNTLAGEREDRRREHEAAEHWAQQSRPRPGHLHALAALKSASKQRNLYGTGIAGATPSGPAML